MEEGLPRRRVMRRAYPGGGLTQEEGKEEGLPRRRVCRRAYQGGEYGGGLTQEGGVPRRRVRRRVYTGEGLTEEEGCRTEPAVALSSSAIASLEGQQ